MIEDETLCGLPLGFCPSEAGSLQPISNVPFAGWADSEARPAGPGGWTAGTAPDCGVQQWPDSLTTPHPQVTVIVGTHSPPKPLIKSDVVQG